MVTLSEGFSVSNTNIGSAYTWNENVNSFSTNASGKVTQSSSAVRVALCTTPLATSDQDVSIQAEGNGAGIALRFTNGDFSGSYTGYRVRINGNTVQIYRWFADFVGQVSVSGGISYPGTLRATIVNNGSGDPAVEIFWNSVSQGTITDTNVAKVTSGLYVGIANNNAAAVTDDWTAQDIGVATVTGTIASDLPGVDQELLGPIADTGLSEPFSVSSDNIGSAYTWTENVNSLTTNASGRVVSSSSAIRVAFPNQNLSSPNHRVEVQAHTLLTGVALRFSDGDFSGSYTGYWVRINSTHAQLFRWFSNYVGQVALPGGYSLPGVIAAEIKNNLDTGDVDVEVFWNGASLGVITDSSLDKLQTGRWAGIFLNAVDAELDNWAAQDTIVESGGSLSTVLAVPIGGGSSASGVTYFSGKIRRSGSTKFSHAKVRDGAWLRSKVRGR